MRITCATLKPLTSMTRTRSCPSYDFGGSPVRADSSLERYLRQQLQRRVPDRCRRWATSAPHTRRANGLSTSVRATVRLQMCIKALRSDGPLTLGPAPVCSNGILPNGPLLDTQYLNLAPRFGISYSPISKMVIRTGYGIFYTQDIGNAYFDMARNIAGRVTVTNADSATGIYGNSNLTWANAAPGGGGGAISNLGPTTAYANAVSHKTTYTEQFLLNIQQQVGQDWSFEVGYQGALQPSSLWVQKCKSGDSIRIHRQLAPQVQLRPGLPSRTWAGSNTCTIRHRKLQRIQHQGYAAVQQRSQRGRLLHLGKIPRRYQRNSQPGERQPVSAEQRVYPVRVWPFRVRREESHRRLGALRITDRPRQAAADITKPWVRRLAAGRWEASLPTRPVLSRLPCLGVDNASIASPFGNFDRPNPTGVSP